MSRSELIVGTLYLDGEMIRQEDGIGFVCPNPILCYIERVDTLDELKNFILRTMGALGQKNVRRVAYRLLNILPPLEYKFKIFWLKGDVHVRAMFDLHRSPNGPHCCSTTVKYSWFPRKSLPACMETSTSQEPRPR
ncbi:hypothetical protein PIB30_034798 [Stylosanthes scabra]|uniref:Uncharacterized protein n=1 Tax=Stylosanthes scabra TaxID=79078 RepID=A0ABU6SCP9_9FABA|nr:hypothetical protein [Stylosanthes scabra]